MNLFCSRPLRSLLAPRHLGALLAAAILMSSATLQAVPFDGVAARINTEIVTMYDVREAAPPFLLQQGIDPSVLQSPTERARIYRQVLEDLIERKLLLQEAKKLGIGVSDEDLEQWVGYMRQQQNMSEEQFKATVEQYGMSYENYREMMRENLLRMRITQQRVGSKVSITDAEVEDAYRTRYGELSRSQRYLKISHILIQPTTVSDADLAVAYERIQKIQARLDAGDDFVTVAKEDSDGPSAQSGGELGSFRRGELDPEFEEAAFKLDEGEVSGIVQTKFGYHIIKILDVEERANPDIEDRLEQLRGELRQIAMERQFKSYIKGLKTRAFVEVKI